MSDPEKKNSPFIRERIVPKKNLKKIVLTVVSVILLALVFGAVAGVAFSVSRNLFGREVVPTESPIIIIPRGSDQEDPNDILMPETTEPETEPPAESSGEETAPASSEEPSEETAESTGSEESTDAEESAEATEPEPITLQTVYQNLQPSLVQVTLELQAGSDWFNEPQTRRRETFAVPIAESEEAVFLLTDATYYETGALFHVYLGNEILIMEPYNVDPFSRLAVLRIYRDLLKVDLPLVPVGYSNSLKAGERVFLFGTLYGRYLAMDEGRITFIAPDESVMDGYRQILYTNMQRSEGGAGLMVSEAGELIGWMSDASAGKGTAAVAYGITSLMDTIGHLYLNERLPYMGVLCRKLSAEEVAGTDRATGIYVQEVLDGSPAFIAGIQPGDRIVSIDLRTVTTNRSFQTRLNSYGAGSSMTIVVGRFNNGAEEHLTLSVILGER